MPSTNHEFNIKKFTFSSHILNILNRKDRIIDQIKSMNLNKSKKLRQRRQVKVSQANAKFDQMDFESDSTQFQFCGEILFYAVEYYCVQIKGSSVYTPDYDFENTYVYDDNKYKRDVKGE